MKKLLVFVGAVALVVWVISWFRAPGAVAVSGAKTWPGGMGTLQDAQARFPAAEANDAARKLGALATALPVSEPVDAFVLREIESPDLTIGEAPALSDVSAIRDLLLRERIVWERYVTFDHGEVIARRGPHMNMARALVAGALVKGRAEDPAAWEDLRAVWNLARSLDGHPQTMSQTAALTMARMVNAVAWKLPLPAPDWFREVQARDSVRPLLEAFQYQAASYWDSGGQMFPTKFLAGSVEHDRRIAEELAGVTACDVSARANKLGTDLTSVWRRAFRYRAEREATANAMRIREGAPIEAKSVCSDGTWSFDGTTLRFSREISSGMIDPAMPLVLRVGG
jgi:hypothetical protein